MSEAPESELKDLVTRLAADFKKRGLFINTYSDKPNEVSPPHAHGGATLVTLEGSAEVRLDNGKWQTVTPGDVTVIKDDQLHEVKAGSKGWKYLFACSQQEARRQGLLGAKPNTEAKAILDAIKYATLATVSSDGDPWNSPVYFVTDEDYTLYWASYTESQHSQNIRVNGKVFITVYDSTVPWGTGTGVFIQAKAREVTDEQEIVKACQLRQARIAEAKQPPDDFVGDKPRRIYSATPKQIWINQDGEVNGNFIDVRKEATE